nr:hypothetical protein [Enterovibrio nigricans]
MMQIFTRLLMATFLLVGVTAQAGEATFPSPLPDKLRVCADPNNLPYSNRKQQGSKTKLPNS